MRQAIEELSKQRFEYCNSCELNKNNTCSSSLQGKAVQDFTYLSEQRFEGNTYQGCGCPLNPKTKSLHSCCPIGKWLSLTTFEESSKIQQDAKQD